MPEYSGFWLKLSYPINDKTVNLPWKETAYGGVLLPQAGHRAFEVDGKG